MYRDRAGRSGSAPTTAGSSRSATAVQDLRPPGGTVGDGRSSRSWRTTSARSGRHGGRRPQPVRGRALPCVHHRRRPLGQHGRRALRGCGRVPLDRHRRRRPEPAEDGKFSHFTRRRPLRRRAVPDPRGRAREPLDELQPRHLPGQAPDLERRRRARHDGRVRVLRTRGRHALGRVQRFHAARRLEGARRPALVPDRRRRRSSSTPTGSRRTRGPPPVVVEQMRVDRRLVPRTSDRS
jgi:hypothetical protein